MHPDKETRHKLRDAHKAEALARMSKHGDVEGRLRALLETQQDTFDKRLDDAKDSLPADIYNALKEEVAAYRAENDGIVAAVVHGQLG